MNLWNISAFAAVMRLSPTVLWTALGIFLFLNIAFAIFSPIATAYFIFQNTMVRKSRETWGRECSEPDPEQISMYETGLAWEEAHRSAKRELHMVNEGLNLYAEYFDFGFDRAVIVIPGRTEGLCYGYYFAAPYEKHGYNLLVIDQRAHGNSDGKYNCIGFDEHRDLLAWAKRLHDEYGVRSILLHGICIGSACGLYALTSEGCPDYLVGLVAEGMFPDFRESYKNHMLEKKKPTFIIPLVEAWMKHYTGYTMRPGPIDYIGRYQKPFLMLHGTADLYSTPEKARLIYQTAGSDASEKRIVWFEGGRHSRLRLMDRERYDGAVEAFLTEVIDRNDAIAVNADSESAKK